MYSKEQVAEIVRRVVERLEEEKVLFQAEAGISERHVYLSRRDLDILFGEGYEPGVLKALKQPKEFACPETVVVAGPKGAIPGVRIYGPLRENTQVELLYADGPELGIECPVNHSGSNEASPEVVLIGPKGYVRVSRGVMAAWRHVHISELTAQKAGLKDGDYVSVRTGGKRALVFHNVRVRVGYYATEVHLDAEEADSAGIRTGDYLEVGYF